MALKPETPHATPPAGNETAIAIVGALVISIVLSIILIGNPFTAARLAYTDYSLPAAAAATPAVPAAATPAVPAAPAPKS